MAGTTHIHLCFSSFIILLLTRNALLIEPAGNQILCKQRDWGSWTSGLIPLFHSPDHHERVRALIGHNTRLIGLFHVWRDCESIALGASSKTNLNRHFLVAIRRDPGPEAETDLRRKRGLVCAISAGAFS